MEVHNNNSRSSSDIKLDDYESGIGDIKRLLSDLWAGKITIFFTTLAASVIAIFFALSMPNIYRSKALLAPISADSAAMSGIASKFGGLASLAGVSLPSGGPDKSLIGIEIIKSRLFFSQFVNRHPVMVDLMASEGWDEIKNEVLIDASIYDKLEGQWVREVVWPKNSEPSIQEAHLVFSQLLSITQDDETGFVQIAVEHQSPYVAKNWVEWLVDDINMTIRQQDVEQAQRSIDYLTKQVQSTQIADLKEGFFELIQSQMETIMLANASSEYLFRTLDPAVVPELKVRPKRALICVLGFLLGIGLGLLLVIMRRYSYH